MSGKMNFWQENIKIGNLSVPRFMSGPLDGITDSPFRQIVRDYSKDNLVYSEMRHVACVANDKGAVKALDFAQLERPLSYQISANKEHFIEQAIEKILASGVDVVDLNIGCPAKNVVKNGAGSALMADLPRLKKILTIIRSSVNIPFTVKIRSGYKEANAVDVAKLAEDCGVDAIAIHPRLQTKKFLGPLDYTLTAAVKKAVNVPILFSGNVVNFKLAKMTHEQTGVDGFLIGRGIWGRPWKLHEMEQHSQGLEFKVDMQTISSVALKHLDLMVKYYGPKGLYCFRKHLPFYVKGFPEASELRKNLVTSDSEENVREKLSEICML
jgi:tRNA-dihydrouridine synthase B